MALKKEAIDKIKSFGFDVDKLIAAISDTAEVDYTVPDIATMSAADLETRDANTRAEGKREGVTEGKAAGLEIAGKALAKKFNLPSTVDTKKLDSVVDAAHIAVATGDAGLHEQIKLLQKDKEALAIQNETIVKEKDALAFDTQIISQFPSNRDNTLSDSERLMLVKANLSFENVEGKAVVKKNGEILRNTTTKDPLPVSEAITALFTERKWVADSTGGRGAGDKTNTGGAGGGIKKASDARVKFKEQNPTLAETSPEATAFLAACAKETTDFDYYS